VRAILQPFVPLLLSWVGRGEVCTLTGVERSGPWMPLNGSGVACGFYLNELLLRLLPRNDSHEQLFERYAHTLEALGGALGTQRILRMFERDLLQELGYALVLERDAESGEPIAEEGLYHYDPQRGPVRVRDGSSGGIVVRGRSLISLLSGDLSDTDSLREAKRLLRAALTPHLGPRPLRSRSLLHGPGHVEA
jgi:DNA repair protein RecO (recombination protein O)